MFTDLSTLLCGGVAVLSAAASSFCAVQCIALKKRLQAVETRGANGGDEFSGDYQALAGRVASMQNSIGLLQSGMAEAQAQLHEAISSFSARLETARPVSDNPFAETPRATEGERRKPKFKAEWETVTPLNLNRRGQMLRMHRRGETIPAIASALGISQGEVKLTLRMQELHSDRPEKENSLDRL